MNWQFWNTISQENWIDIGISIGVILLFLILRKLFTKYVFYIIVKLTKKTKSEFLNQVVAAFERPLRWVFILIGVYIALDFFPYIDQHNQLLTQLLRAGYILLITWGLYNLSSNSSFFFMKLNSRTNIQIDKILIPFLSKAIRVIIVIISISVIAEVFGYKVSGLVAGLGIGGLAFALAAQEVVKNLFGGVVIITEKPFSIGEWIKTPTVEGIVEDINFRSTLIRTFADAVITIPNSTLSNEPITNWSKMGKRQISFNLGVEYSTPKDKLETVNNKIKEYLENHPEVHQETLFVRFTEFNHSSLDIMLYFFTKTTVWGEYLRIKEEINFKIMEILESEGVSIAFPSQTIYFNENSKHIVKNSSQSEE
ncbi:mechanosensitive ion channel family protein [Gracilibacillus oryzae]|uniref:Mechanosensitive ion channel family protein n=1 Tax=Gracilibacillus oryzae TaxID=1672701 RepID=A0A7C8GVU8_9BACI|nr:mechanosensitive ion channel family protein [Gracilibacillus oryzae]KAB8139032.1 mechanosensitive ion channel family protein [Gracilibacillus oryzae]